MEKYGKDNNDISTELKLWKSLHKTCKLPLPRCRYLKPFIITKWNLMKPPSDTITKIIDSINAVVPIPGS